MTTPKHANDDFPAWPQFGDEERAGLWRTLDQGQWWRVAGAEVDAFERELAAYHGAARALAVTNGTHALELGLELLGVGPGDEVIVPGFTFISSSLAVQRRGAVPVPVEVTLDTYCIDLDATAAAVTPRTRAIMPVHMAGQMVDMDRLTKIAADAGCAVLQDAAHAHGARWRGQRVGELGSVACLSFQNGKLMTAGEGGALLLPNEDLYQQAFLRHSCGRPASDRLYDHPTSGSNYRMNEFSGAVLRAQLARLDSQIHTREARWATLERLLAAVPGVQPQGRDDRCDLDPHYMAMFRLPGAGEQRRNRVVEALVQAGVPAFVTFRPVYRAGGFWEGPTPDLTEQQLAERCPNVELVATEGIWLHHRVLLAEEAALERLAGTLADVLRHLR